MKINFFAILFLILLTACGTAKKEHLPVPLYQDQYLVVEKINETVLKVGDKILSFSQFKMNIKDIAEASGTKKILFGLESEFKKANLIDFYPTVNLFGGEMYYLNENKEIKSFSF